MNVVLAYNGNERQFGMFVFNIRLNVFNIVN